MTTKLAEGRPPQANLAQYNIPKNQKVYQSVCRLLQFFDNHA